MSHYETLGVAPDADKPTIKKAYRRKASEKHPDSGGSTEEMAKVNVAYAVLSDDTRRAKYDQTGDDREAASAVEAAHAVLAQLFTQGLERHAKDLVKFARSNIENHIAQMSQAKSQLRKKITHLSSRRADVKTTNALNVFHALIDSQVAAGEQQMQQLEAQVASAQAALDMLENYSSTVVEPEPRYTSFMGTGSTTSTWG